MKMPKPSFWSRAYWPCHPEKQLAVGGCGCALFSGPGSSGRPPAALVSNPPTLLGSGKSQAVFPLPEPCWVKPRQLARGNTIRHTAWILLQRGTSKGVLRDSCSMPLCHPPKLLVISGNPEPSRRGLPPSNSHGRLWNRAQHLLHLAEN